MQRKLAIYPALFKGRQCGRCLSRVETAFRKRELSACCTHARKSIRNTRKHLASCALKSRVQYSRRENGVPLDAQVLRDKGMRFRAFERDDVKSGQTKVGTRRTRVPARIKFHVDWQPQQWPNNKARRGDEYCLPSSFLSSRSFFLVRCCFLYYVRYSFLYYVYTRRVF